MAYTYQQIEDLWVQYGGNPASAAMAAAIAMAESGGNPNAINTANSNGTTDRGLFQINSVHGAQSSTDLATNVRAAISISSNGGNWQPWSTFNNGAYSRFFNSSIKPSGATVAQIGGSSGSSGGTSGSTPGVMATAPNDDTCALPLKFNFPGGSLFNGCILHKSNVRAFIGGFMIAGGVVVTLAGVYTTFQYGFGIKLPGPKPVKAAAKFAVAAAVIPK